MMHLGTAPIGVAKAVVAENVLSPVTEPSRSLPDLEQPVGGSDEAEPGAQIRRRQVLAARAW